MNHRAWKTAAAGGPFSPPPDYPGVSPRPASEDATKLIWHDPSKYNPFTHGPPYFPEMKVARVASEAEDALQGIIRVTTENPGVALPSILTILRALASVHQSHHWLTYGASFVGDHALFEELYDNVNEEIDKVAERAVGSGSPLETLHPAVQLRQVTLVVEALCGNGETTGEGENPDSYVATSLKAERGFLQGVGYVAEALKQANALSRGTDNLLGEIEDQHEKHVFKLSQRAKSVPDALWKAR